MYLTALDPISRDFDRLVRRAFGPSAFGTAFAPALPMATVRRDGEVVLKFDVPGVDSDKIDVTVDRGVLTVSANRAEEYAEGESPYRRERVMGTFTRRVSLSDTIDSEKIDAGYTNGVLSVRLPLLEKAQPRKVEVHTGDQKKIAA